VSVSFTWKVPLAATFPDSLESSNLANFSAGKLVSPTYGFPRKLSNSSGYADPQLATQLRRICAENGVAHRKVVVLPSPEEVNNFA
jgi:hypothetical protein